MSTSDYSARGIQGTVYCLVSMLAPDGAGTGEAQLTVENLDTGNIIHEDDITPTYDPDQSRLYIVTETANEGQDLSDTEVEICLDVSNHPSDATWKLSYGNTVRSDHIHEQDSGIIEFPGNTPSNVGVEVNGNQVASAIGNGTFEETVDLTGELQEDAWNKVAVTSDSLGAVQASGSILAYRQIGERPD
jgi:hypothetical protein